jgi:hypothetical protein
MDGFGKDLRTIASPTERISEIQKQLAYLQWRRTQVEGSIRAIVDNEKTVAEHDQLLSLSRDEVRAKQIWTQEIVADELCKPLELSKQFVTGVEEADELLREKEEKSRTRHRKNLNLLKEKVLKQPQSPSSDKVIQQICELEGRLSFD